MTINAEEEKEQGRKQQARYLNGGPFRQKHQINGARPSFYFHSLSNSNSDPTWHREFIQYTFKTSSASNAPGAIDDNDACSIFVENNTL